MNNRPVINLKNYETRFAQFDSLMRFRIKNILFVASLYDAYILEEDGQLAELVSSRFVELNLSLAPHVKRVTTGLEALNLLRENSYDLVIVFRGLSDIDLASFATESKRINPDIPVALLAFHARELEVLEHGFPVGAIDKAFFWTGDVNIVLTIVKHFEDKRNVDHDTKLLGVRVIIVIEDSVRFYSAYLPLIYSEILSQTRALMADGLNQADKILRMRARPKILLADNFEEGWEMFLRYKKFLLGVISDVRYIRNGKLDDTAGMAFAKLARLEVPDLPILLQSSDPKYKNLAQTAGTAFLNKNAPNLLGRLRAFIKNNFGFGAFVFRMPDGGEVGRAEDFYDMEQALQKIPAESIIYHANRNHFSNWLMARTEFDLAARIRPRTVSEFKGAEALRNFLIESFRGFRRAQQAGIVTDFRRDQFENDAAFLRIGEGSLGGKGRGLAFINSLMSRYQVFEAFEGFRVSVPRSTVIATSVFDNFMEANDLYDFALEDNSDDDIAAAFLKAKMPKDTLVDLKIYLESTKYPLAVRSSSLLEDSHYQPFAGIFITHMLPNNHDNIKIRLKRLEEAIKYTYASIYFRNSKNYIETTGNRVEEEKMAVILQKVVGAERHGAYYPVFSGIARSYNFYPVGNMKPDEGVAYIALGLGKTVVDGSKCLRFSPSRPHVLPQFGTTKDMLTNSQKDFYAIDMTKPEMHPDATGESSLIKLEISHAEKDGTLKYVGSSVLPPERPGVRRHWPGRGTDGDLRTDTQITQLCHRRNPAFPFAAGHQCHGLPGGNRVRRRDVRRTR